MLSASEYQRELFIRETAFAWLDNIKSKSPDEVIAYQDIKEGFFLPNEERIRIIHQKGITPIGKHLKMPISIVSSEDSIYSDQLSDDGLIQYSYQKDGEKDTGNIGLKKLHETGLPLIYLYRLNKGRYLSFYPAIIVGDSPGTKQFSVAVNERSKVYQPLAGKIIEGVEDSRILQRYTTQQVRVRLHQGLFREKVLTAYRKSCAVCNLKHTNLLDAAHIIPDSEQGEPVVSNGLTLCKLHHSAYDSNILGITPDFKVEIRVDIMEEVDGPILKHGLQEMKGRKIQLPRTQINLPNKEHLDLRYQRFLNQH